MPKRRRRDQDGIYERSDSPYYWASYIDASGQRVRCSTGVRKSIEGRKEAEALLAKWRVEQHRSQHWKDQPPKTFDELMVEYLKATESKRSASKDRQRCKTLRRFFGGRIMNDLVPVDIRRYIALRRKEKISDSTINRETALLSAAINYANREWDWQLPNPAKGRRLAEPEGRVRWLTRAEAGVLLQQAEKDSQARQWLPEFIRLALNTGCRKQELLGLEWRRVDLQAGLIHLEAQHTKGARRRSVPLNTTARTAILSRARFRAKWCPGSPWVFCNRKGMRVENVRRSFMTACTHVGIEDFRIHDLRHTCAAWLVSAGVPLTEVRDLLGHRTIRMTERYAHLAPENVRAAVALLDGVESRSSHVVELGNLKETEKTK